jgi:hypothetical protein
MADRHILTLTKGNRSLAVKGVINAPDGYVLELREARRSDPQNAALHGLIAQIIKQRPTHNGIRMDKALWKATFMQALGEEVRFVPTLEGDGVFPIGLSTRELPKGRFADLMELIMAWMSREGLSIEHFDAAEDRGAASNAPRRAA